MLSGLTTTITTTESSINAYDKLPGQDKQTLGNTGEPQPEQLVPLCSNRYFSSFASSSPQLSLMIRKGQNYMRTCLAFLLIYYIFTRPVMFKKEEHLY